MLVLGIESSCDETAAALVEDGHNILSNVVASQVKTHRSFGGVVPELASREHLRNIGYVVRKAFSDAGLGYQDVDGLAVTQGPGLIGSLLVGLSFAKAMAFSLKKPLVPVNHIEGHIYSAFIEHPDIAYPFLALVVSGGHTSLIYSPEPERYELVARLWTSLRNFSAWGIRAGPLSTGCRLKAIRADFTSRFPKSATAVSISASAASKRRRYAISSRPAFVPAVLHRESRGSCWIWWPAINRRS
jgi:hypothetical protein